MELINAEKGAAAYTLEGNYLKANCLEAACEGATLFEAAKKGGFSRIVQGTKRAKYPIRALLICERPDPEAVRALGFNRILESGEIYEAATSAVEDALTYAEALALQLHETCSSYFLLPKNLAECGSAVETIKSLSAECAPQQKILLPYHDRLLQELVDDLMCSPLQQAQNLLPCLKPDLQAAGHFFEAGDLLGFSGAVFKLDKLPEKGSPEEGALWAWGHGLFLGYSPLMMYKYWKKINCLC
ncbi:MAG: hypothetical protein KDK48_01880 [Chlamydiia bacterium]|nr:hypothetical protein [Chlamydiia bacterium]